MIDKKDNKQTKKYYYISKKVRAIDKSNFYEYLSVMIDGGVTLSEALSSVNTKISNYFFKEKIEEIITYISSGDSLSKSMKKNPDIFDSSEISIIEAGESTGMLVESLKKLAEDLLKAHNLKKKIKGSLTYPVIIFLFLIFAVIIVLIYVIPAIKPLFETSEVELPTATKALLFTSDFIRNNFISLLFFFFSVFVAFVGYKNTLTGRKHLESLLLGFPLIGKVYRNYILSGIASNLGGLVGSGVSIVKALTLTGKSTNNILYESMFDAIVRKVTAGEKIVDSMQELDEENYYFPISFLQMLSVGEKTASIERISRKMNEQYTTEVNNSLSSLVKWIEPIAILIAGIFVLWFAFAIFGAILKVTDIVG
ncbi:hypothetical protein CSA08_01860 [Candidatus Gracilibacteria bacterium]|nr:MAG: hypothetical protein CSA08_01860 [Candidatus Gracilibacteria bacterium]